MPLRTDVFFYGLFMDTALLRGKGVDPQPGSLGVVRDWALRIGQRATMVPRPGSEVHGVLMSLTLRELEELYADPSVRIYRPVAVQVALAGERHLPALAYVLPDPPAPHEHNTEYASKLRTLGDRLGLPPHYTSSLA
jgi:Gamma-glutamyl cyclotransferase, AIG2-like